MYLTYEEYQLFGGTIPESAFNLLEFSSRKQIDKQTFGRLQDLEEQPDEVKKCMFLLIGLNDTKDDHITSESVDGYSISYIDGKSFKEYINGVIRDSLSTCEVNGVPCLYRGV